MRLWSLHPRYLDPQGLVAVWREALLAQKVLRGETRGYRSHPQLIRFGMQAQPLAAIGAYLSAVHAEAGVRGYAFDRSKFVAPAQHAPMPVTAGQLTYEWEHLLAKLAARNPAVHQRWRHVTEPACHPLFHSVPGGIEPWERVQPTRAPHVETRQRG